MIKNYIKIAWRNLGSNKVSTFINIGGLAVGMAVALLIGLWVYDELSFDKYHRNYDRIAQVMQHQTLNGTIYTGNAIPFPLGRELQDHYGSNFKYVVMSSWSGNHILSTGDKKISQDGMYMDVDAPRMLTLTMLKGNAGGLKEPNSILLAASTSKALFGDAEPVNQLLKIDNKLNVKVTGVYEDLPFNTQFNSLHFTAPWDLYASSQKWIQQAKAESHWDDNSFQLFVQIADNTDFATVDKRIVNAKLNHVAPEDKKFNPALVLHPMRNWHLRSEWENGKNTGGLIEYVWLFSMIGVFVLLLACINFMNLSTARSEKRAKEVGIRKAIGSLRGQLIAQFYSESLLVVVFAFVLCLILVQLVLPWFNSVANKKMILPWLNPLFWLMGIGITFITGMIAGSYPALYLSSFQPVKVLKGTFRVGKLASLPRKALVVLQFTISLALIIGTLVVYSQVQYSKNRPIGYSRNGLVMISMKSPDFYGKYDLLRNTLKENGAIEDMAESSSPLTGVWSNNGGFNWPGKNPNQDADFATIWITHDFGKTVGWQFTAGRDLSRTFPTDSSSIILNETAVKFMNIKNPLGTQVRWGDDVHGKTFTVVGVIKDMVMESPYQPVKQSIYFMDYEKADWIILKLNPAQSAAVSLAKMEAVFKKFIPSAPFDYQFADEAFAYKFANEERIGKLSTFFAALAVFISCLGLFGLASFVAEQRTKEIGVRKVLGATVTHLWGLLSKDFVVLVIISCFIAGPLAWLFMHKWLQKYEYRTAISGWIFVAAAMCAMLITLLTVSYQAIQAALANPVKSLRSE